MKKFKVAVLLAAYNGKDWIEEQITSIFNQKKVNIHLFISVDKSNDGTHEFCRNLAQQNDNVTLLDTTKTFGSAAQNFFRLIRDTKIEPFDFIALSDQDDVWHTDKIDRAISALIRQECDGYSSNVLAFWPDGNEILIQKAEPQVEWDFLFESPGPGCSFVLTKTLALELQKFLKQNTQVTSSIWVHDWLLYAYARANNYKWYIDEKPSMHYRQHNSNEIGANSGFKAILNRAKFVLSGKAMEQSSLIASLCKLEQNCFVKKWYKHERKGMLFLALNSNKCRRKKKHQLFFIFSCLLLFVTGNKKQ